LDLRGSTTPSLGREGREKIEKELFERRKKVKKGDGRRTDVMKFVLLNRLFIEWKVCHYTASTQSSFIKDTPLPLSEGLLSIEEEEKEEEDTSLLSDSFKGDSIITSTRTESSLSSPFSFNVNILFCSQRKFKFWNILSHSSFLFSRSTRVFFVQIFKHLFSSESMKK
jgi:hypothetical protein